MRCTMADALKFFQLDIGDHVSFQSLIYEVTERGTLAQLGIAGERIVDSGSELSLFDLLGYEYFLITI